MVGSAVVGWLVDRNKAFKLSIVSCLLAASAAMLYLLHFGPKGQQHIWIGVLAIGLFTGPLQPLAIETGVEVSCIHTQPRSSPSPASRAHSFA